VGGQHRKRRQRRGTVYPDLPGRGRHLALQHGGWRRAVPEVASPGGTRSATTTRRCRAALAPTVALGTGTAAFYQDANGNAAAPPAGEIENPNPKPGTNNNYTQDGYGSSTVADTGGSYSNCSDPAAPGVSAIDAYLSTLPYRAFNTCQPGHYYLLNNYNPGYTITGALDTSAYHIPPQQPGSGYVTIGDALSARHISWAWYGEGFANGTTTGFYCGFCDPMQYSASIMTNPALRANVQHGLPGFLADARAGTLPAVSFLKPEDADSHPGYSSVAAFETFLHNAISAVQSNPREWASTAIFITWDEAGGSYDSGYIQPVSFLGDGPRVPLIVVSPWARHGAVDHTYNDHVSILKLIEANWGLPPLTSLGETTCLTRRQRGVHTSPRRP
jgi:phospholipase C